VHVYGVPVARAALVWKNNSQVELTYDTVGPADLIWDQHNYYKTNFDSLTFGLRKFNKKIEQKNFIQKTELQYMAGNLKYKDALVPRSEDFKTIFTLISLLRNETALNLDGNYFILDHEGKLFDARFLWADTSSITDQNILCDYYRLDLKPVSRTEPFYEDTDTFMDYVSRPELIRQIWVERYGKRRIIKALMNVHGLPFEVNIKND